MSLITVTWVIWYFKAEVEGEGKEMTVSPNETDDRNPSPLAGAGCVREKARAKIVERQAKRAAQIQRRSGLSVDCID